MRLRGLGIFRRESAAEQAKARMLSAEKYLAAYARFS